MVNDWQTPRLSEEGISAVVAVQQTRRYIKPAVKGVNGQEGKGAK